MIDTSHIAGYIGADVLDAQHERLGTVAQIFVSPADGQPRWMAVHHGSFGRDWIAPLLDASNDDDAVTLPFDKGIVKHAPRVDAAAGLTPEHDRLLSDYYDNAAPSGRVHARH